MFPLSRWEAQDELSLCFMNCLGNFWARLFSRLWSVPCITQEGLLLFLSHGIGGERNHCRCWDIRSSLLAWVMWVWLLSNEMAQNRDLAWSQKATDFSGHEVEESAEVNFILRIILSKDKDRDSDSHTFSWKTNHGFESAPHSCVWEWPFPYFLLAFSARESNFKQTVSQSTSLLS